MTTPDDHIKTATELAVKLEKSAKHLTARNIATLHEKEAAAIRFLLDLTGYPLDGNEAA
jgi:hypothetical protein